MKSGSASNSWKVKRSQDIIKSNTQGTSSSGGGQKQQKKESSSEKPHNKNRGGGAGKPTRTQQKRKLGGVAKPHNNKSNSGGSASKSKKISRKPKCTFNNYGTTLRRLDSLASLFSLNTSHTACVATALYKGRIFIASNEAKRQGRERENAAMQRVHGFILKKIKLVRRVLFHFMDGIAFNSDPNVSEVMLTDKMQRYIEGAIQTITLETNGGYDLRLDDTIEGINQEQVSLRMQQRNLVKLITHTLLGVLTGGRKGFRQEELHALLFSDVTFLYRNTKSLDLKSSPHGGPSSLHAEQALFSYIKRRYADRAGRLNETLSIGISKLCCQVCAQALKHEVDVVVRGESGQFWPFVYDSKNRAVGVPTTQVTRFGATLAPESRSPAGFIKQLQTSNRKYLTISHPEAPTKRIRLESEGEATFQTRQDLNFRRQVLGSGRRDLERVEIAIRQFWRAESNKANALQEQFEAQLENIPTDTSADSKPVFKKLLTLFNQIDQCMKNQRRAAEFWTTYSGKPIPEASKKAIAIRYQTRQEHSMVLQEMRMDIQEQQQRQQTKRNALPGGATKVNSREAVLLLEATPLDTNTGGCAKAESNASAMPEELKKVVKGAQEAAKKEETEFVEEYHNILGRLKSFEIDLARKKANAAHNQPQKSPSRTLLYCAVASAAKPSQKEKAKELDKHVSSLTSRRHFSQIALFFNGQIPFSQLIPNSEPIIPFREEVMNQGNTVYRAFTGTVIIGRCTMVARYDSTQKETRELAQRRVMTTGSHSSSTGLFASKAKPRSNPSKVTRTVRSNAHLPEGSPKKSSPTTVMASSSSLKEQINEEMCGQNEVARTINYAAAVSCNVSRRAKLPLSPRSKVAQAQAQGESPRASL